MACCDSRGADFFADFDGFATLAAFLEGDCVFEEAGEAFLVDFLAGLRAADFFFGAAGRAALPTVC